MKRFKSARHLQRFVSIHEPIANLHHFPRHGLSSIDYRSLRAEAMNSGAAANTTIVGASASDPEAQRRVQEIEAAHVSRLFAQTNERERSIAPIAPTAISAVPTQALTLVNSLFGADGSNRTRLFTPADPRTRTPSPDPA